MKNANKDNVVSLPQVMLSLLIKGLHDEIAQLKKKANSQAVRALLKALEIKDEYTYGHSIRVAFYSLCLGKEMGLSNEELLDLETSALFHDIGKLGTPEQVLNKPTRLDENEFAIMKEHPVLTGKLLSELEGFEKIAEFAKHHHERYDGRGYPNQLKGEDIPLFSRIILIADTFDAMTSSRPYRKGLSYEVAYQELKDFSGSQFDPNLVGAFIRAMVKEQNKKSNTFNISLLEEKFNKEAA